MFRLTELPGKNLAKQFKLFAATIVIALAAYFVYAGQPLIWETSGRADLLKGDARGVSISDTGVLMLAPKLTEVFNTQQTYIWSSTSDNQGNVFLGRGHHEK